MRKALDIVEDYHRAGTFRKLDQRRLETLPQLTPFRRIPESRGYGIRQLLRIPDLAAPGKIERRVRDDPIEPCAKRL